MEITEFSIILVGSFLYILTQKKLMCRRRIPENHEDKFAMF